MSQLTGRILFLKFVRILKFVKIREFREFLKFIKFEFLIYELKEAAESRSNTRDHHQIPRRRQCEKQSEKIRTDDLFVLNTRTEL